MTHKPMLRVEVGAVSCSRCACVAHKGNARENRGAWANEKQTDGAAHGSSKDIAAVEVTGPASAAAGVDLFICQA